MAPEAAKSASAQPGEAESENESLKLSFCVPVYNLEAYLDECLESLTGQTYQNIEVICVDDGSTDGSPEKLSTWTKRDIRVRVITQANAGEGAARNAAIQHATGDYVAFVDGDDFIDVRTADLTLEAAQRTDADIVVYGGRAFPDVDWITDTFGPRDAALVGNGADILLAEQGCIPSACNKLYRRSLLSANDARFDENLRLGPDLNFQFKVFPLATRITLVSDRLYHYRYNREGSAINQNYAKRVSQLMQHLELFDITAANWQARGLLEGRKTEFLGAIELIFGDFNLLEPAEMHRYACAFAPVFERYFTRDDLHPRMGIEALMRYCLMLDLADSDGTASSIARLVRPWRRKMKLVELYRAVRYGRSPKGEASATAASETSSRAQSEAASTSEAQLPEVSIIIPAFNAEATIERALYSALAQEGARVQVIAIDDASTDQTPIILDAFAEVCPNVQVVHHEHNRGRLEARRSGIQAARSEWCMFLDADDELLPDCAQRLFEGQRGGFDIVQCSFEIRTIDYIEPDELRFTQQFCAVPNCRAFGDDVCDLVFGARKTTWSLCGKLLRTAQLREAMEHIAPATLNQAEDCCIFFIVSCLATSYRGIGGYEGYVYNIDEGGSDARWSSMDLQQFRFTCNFVSAMDAIQRFLVNTDRMTNPKLRAAYRTTRHEHAITVADKLLQKVRKPERAEAFDIFASEWPRQEAVAMIAESGWNAPAATWEDVHAARTLACTPRKLRTIGIYHSSMGTGGAERIGALLARLWAAQGMKVVVFADCPQAECAWKMPEQVEWVQLPASEAVTPATYQMRADALAQGIARTSVDAFVYQQWWNPLLPWDMMAIKACDVPVCLLTHGSFDTLFYMGRIREYELTKIFRYADALVVLTEADVQFWQRFNPRVFQMSNPVMHSFDDAANRMPSEPLADEAGSACEDSVCSNKSILWVGRLSEVQKRPSEAIRIMARVIASEPEATLTLVGPSDADELANLQALVHELGLEGHVVFAGAQADVAPFYEKATAYLLTSRFESWCLSLAEAMDAGLPTVMYRLDHLTLARSNEGIIAVEQGDRDAAAQAIVELIRNHALREKMGHAAQARLAEVERFDLTGLWDKVFAALSQGSPNREGFEAADAQWDLLFSGLEAGLEEAANQPFFSFVMRKGLGFARRMKHRLIG